MERVIVNVEVVVIRDDRYLLIVRGDGEEYGAGWLALPGGKLEVTTEFERSLEVTAQRELREEVDLDVSLEELHYAESHTFFIGDVPVLDVVMVTTNAEGEARAVDEQEVREVVWMTEQEVFAHPDIPVWTRKSLAHAITYVLARNR